MLEIHYRALLLNLKDQFYFYNFMVKCFYVHCELLLLLFVLILGVNHFYIKREARLSDFIVATTPNFLFSGPPSD
jgi:hypothetical protein